MIVKELTRFDSNFENDWDWTWTLKCQEFYSTSKFMTHFW